MVIMSFRFSKKKIAFIVGLFLFAITAVLFGGKIVGVLSREEATVQKIGLLMGGISEEEEK